MKITPENIALFDEYLRDNLTQKERLEFENKLQQNPELKAEFESFEALETAIQHNEIIQFKEKLNQWDKEKKEETPSSSKVIRLRFLAIASSVILVVGFGIRFFFTNPSNQSLVDDRFFPYDNVLTIRGEKEDIDDGLKQYEQKHYELAIEQFVKYPSNENALFYLAESQMALKRYSKAIENYKAVIKLDNLFKEVATYHLALAYLGNNENSAAVELLETIDTAHHYAADAAALLEDLK